MMNKINAVALPMLLALALSTSALGKEHVKKQANSTESIAPIVSGKSSKTVEEFVKDAKGRVSKCESEYYKYLMTKRAAELAWEAGYDAKEARERLTGVEQPVPVMRQTEPYHKNCAEAEKGEFVPMAKTFIKSSVMKSQSAQKAGKDMIAQWITAIDAIGNDGGKLEVSKFETLANGLLLE